jgi:hypothetical protein
LRGGLEGARKSKISPVSEKHERLRCLGVALSGPFWKGNAALTLGLRVHEVRHHLQYQLDREIGRDLVEHKIASKS